MLKEMSLISMNVHQIMGYADAQRHFVNSLNNKGKGRLTLCTPSFCDSDHAHTLISDKEVVMRITLPPCDVGSSGQSSKQRQGLDASCFCSLQGASTSLFNKFDYTRELTGKTNKLKATQFNQCEVSSYENP